MSTYLSFGGTRGAIIHSKLLIAVSFEWVSQGHQHIQILVS